MKFGQFMSYSKRNNIIKKLCKKCSLKTSSVPFRVCKELTKTFLENEIFEAIYLYLICNSKAIEIIPNQHAGKSDQIQTRFLFTENSLKIKKGLELVSRPHFP